MAKNNDNGELKKTSCSVHIKKENIEKYNNIKEKSSFVSKLINNYLDGSLVDLNLPEDIAEKFRKDATKDWIIPKLLVEYYNNNILFVSDFLRMKNLTQQQEIGNQPINANNTSMNCDEANTTSIINNNSKDDNIINDEVVADEETSLELNEEDETVVEVVQEEKDNNITYSESKENKEENVSEEPIQNIDINTDKDKNRKTLFARKK
ncbi:MAG: hypothetical protein E6860_15590 [Clostridium sp.]|uniref:hypothetical protein n=1 Tax=Clostridium sp. TaxID=1506 RepID=UPI002902F86A|nr:hypothetical protein [Clostridium sp.]MDU1586957.1 hypothetical protein [Clostridium sp.]